MVAIGVFALGIIVVVGLFAPLARSVGENAEAEAAAHLGDAIRLELAARVRASGSFAPVTALLKTGAAAERSGDTRDAQLLFANRAGTKVGAYDAGIWSAAQDEGFFEIALFRNDVLSPAGAEDTAIVLAYTARIRWPARQNEAGAGNRDDRTVLFLNGAVARWAER